MAATPPTERPVLVTGGAGHLGFVLACELARSGYRVRATLRPPRTGESGAERARRERVMAEFSALEIETCAMDLLDPPAVRNAVSGVRAVFHVAAPNPHRIRDVESEVLKPTLDGTRNLLEAMEVSEVSDLIFTASCSAIGLEAPEGRLLNEEDSNPGLNHPVTRSKSTAESMALNWGKSGRGRVQVLNLPWMIGPGFHRATGATASFVDLARGKTFALPDIGFHLVDSRDVARGHRLAYERLLKTGKPDGRVILAGKYFRARDLMTLLKSLDSDLRIARVPWLAVRIASWLDRIASFLTGSFPRLSRGALRDLRRCDQRLDTARAEQLIGWSPRPAEETLRDTLAWAHKGLADGLLGGGE